MKSEMETTDYCFLSFQRAGCSDRCGRKLRKLRILTSGGGSQDLVGVTYIDNRSFKM